MDVGLRLARTYCECDLSSMRDFFREDVEKVQDAGQGGRVCSERVDHVLEDVFPLGHLDGQVRQTDAEHGSDGLGPGMEGRQVSHDGCAQLGKLCAGHLVEVVDNLALLGEACGLGGKGQTRTLPLSVVAAKSLAAASTELDSIMASVVVQASCYRPVPSAPCPVSSVPTCAPTPPTYRLLKLLEKLMGLLFLRAGCPRRHGPVRRQHRLEDMLCAAGRHDCECRGGRGW